MRLLRLCVFVMPLALTAGACESELDRFPTTPDPVTVTETFTGSINVNGAASHVFFTSATGTVTATLVSLGDEPPDNVGLAMGTWSGAACTIVLANDRAVVTSVLTGIVSTLGGSLCVRIYDVGSVTASTPYVITVAHP